LPVDESVEQVHLRESGLFVYVTSTKRLADFEATFVDNAGCIPESAKLASGKVPDASSVICHIAKVRVMTLPRNVADSRDTRRHIPSPRL